MYKKVLIFLVIISVSTLLIGCENNELVDLNDKSELYIKSFTKEDTEYFLYFFMETCGHCQSIADDIDDYISNGSINLYKVNLTRKSQSTWEEFDIEGTPTLFHVISIKGKTYIKEKVSGSTAVEKYLDKQ